MCVLTAMPPVGGKNRRAWRRRSEPADHALGRSRGGFGTKLHLAVEGGGLPVNVVLSAGQAHESRFVEPVLDGVHVRQRRGRPRMRPQRAALDRGYSVRPVRAALERRHIVASIPETHPQRAARERRGRRAPHFDRQDYRRREGVERCVGRLKEPRRIATRYEKLAVRYLAFVHLAMIREYLRTLSNTA
jgi:transposase